jgi:glycosyltransferase involved in cell wall biosynthesis
MANQYLTGRDIILFSLKSWDTEIGSSSKQYARVFAKNNNRVLFVNRALDRISTIRSRKDPKIKARLESLHSPERALQEVEDNIWVFNPPVVLESINWISRPGVFDLFNKMNNRKLARRINKAAAGLGFKEIILYIENDFIRSFYLQGMIDGVAKTIYYIRDYLPSQDYFKTHGERLEPKMIQKADVVATNSVHLMKYAKKYNPSSYFVGQGCDLRIFSGEDFGRPADMEGIGKPVVGYTGAILKTRLDAELIRRIALERKDWNIVMVGPEDDHFRNSGLHGLPNVYFLGRKRLDELPAYVQYFDVCINPQLVNEMTIGNYPLKADEYLAMGKPMVATRTDGMKMFEGHVSLCETPEDYITAIGLHLATRQDERIRQERRAFAATHTWDNCVLVLDEVLRKL